MLGDFQLIKEGRHIGNFRIDSSADIWEYRAAAEFAEQPLLFRLAFSQRGGEVLSGDVIRNWISNRAPEPNYHFLDTLMDKVGIKEYDPLAFVAYNSGRFNTDKYYLEGPGMRAEALLE